MKLTNIASLDPAITSTGRKGLSGASSADRKMWDQMQSDWEGFALESESAVATVVEDAQPRVREHENPEIEDYFGTDIEVKSKSRVRQGFFRQMVLSAYNNRCCISGLSIPELLVASHIIPWHADINNRLNPRNGLALSNLHDKAFDLGLITINDDMTVRVSDKNTTDNDTFYDIAIKNYANMPIALPEKFHPLEEFLDYHRRHIFRG